MNPSKKGLILAGGGAKGSYQVGVWQALCELGWYPDIITGTSIGSLNGAMFALDAAPTARAMWLSVRSQDVITPPPEEATPSALRVFLRDMVRTGGLDISPLESMVDLVLDEDALRASPIAFGLVTVEMLGLHRKQLPLSEIPHGKVKDYLLASAACFPAFPPREIDGTYYLDGGYQDLMPHQLAIEMGATALVCVDIDGLGITRKNPLKDSTTLIASHWDLGDMLQFDPDNAARNITLGHHDTLRAFGKLRGTAYAIQPPEDERSIANIRVRYDRLLLACAKYNPTLALSELAALRLFNATDKDLAPLELAAEVAGVDPTALYTVESLCAAFFAAFVPEYVEKLNNAWAGVHPAAVRFAGRKPSEFVATLLYLALTVELSQDFTDDAETLQDSSVQDKEGIDEDL